MRAKHYTLNWDLETTPKCIKTRRSDPIRPPKKGKPAPSDYDEDDNVSSSIKFIQSITIAEEFSPVAGEATLWQG